MDLSAEEILILKNRAASGAQLNDLQKVIQNIFGKNITYMETRFLVSDLEIEILTDKPVEPAEPTQESPIVTPEPEQTEEVALGVKVVVDQITKPGVMVSGQVVWSDRVLSHWYLDQSGQLGLDTEDGTYQPNQSDIHSFQTQLRELLGA